MCAHPRPGLSPIYHQRAAEALAVVACVAVGGLIAAVACFKVASVDIGYHLAYGNHFLTHGEIVDRDPFLLPRHAIHFVNANWGSQVLMTLVYQAAGANGLIVLRMVLLTVVFVCIALVLGRIARLEPEKTDAQPLKAAGRRAFGLKLAWCWLLAGLAGYERFSMRPELFSYAALSVLLFLLTRGIRSWRSICLLAGLQVAWVNLHSYFLVGILLTGSFLMGDAAARAWQRLRHQAIGRHAGGLRYLGAALLIQIAACVINPWHIRGAVHPLATLRFLQTHKVIGTGGDETPAGAWAEISEFQSPFAFHGQIINARTIEAYYVLLAVSIVGLALQAIRRRWGPAVVLLVFITMSMYMRRNIALLAFVGPPLSIGAMALTLRGGLAGWSRRGATALGLATTLLASWWIFGVATGRFYYSERRVVRQLGGGFNPAIWPEDAVRWLARQPELRPELFVDYFASSNVLPLLPGRFRLFVDTNTFAYEEQVLRTAFDLGLGRIPHGELFDQYGINVILLHSGPDTQVLIRNLVHDDGEWALVYFDSHVVIFVRRIPAHLDVIAANQVGEKDLAAAAWIASLHQPRYYKALSLGTMVNVPMSLGWHQPAVRLLDEAVRLAPDYYDAWHYLGVCHGNLGNAAARIQRYDEARRQWTRALECFEKVLVLKHDHAEAAAYRDATRQRLDLLQEVQSLPSAGLP